MGGDIIKYGHREKVARNTKSFMGGVRAQAASDPKHIAFPEGTEDRILQGVRIALGEKTISHATLLGNPEEVRAAMEKNGLSKEDGRITLIDPATDPRRETFIQEYAELRKEKGMTREEAERAFSSVGYPLDAPNYHPKYFGRMYFATMLLAKGEVDGVVSGSTTSTGHTLLPALQLIGLAEGNRLVSSCFFMVGCHGVTVFGDSAVNPDPTAEQLADIAIQSARTARAFGIDPRVGMLSFSTNGSASHPLVDKVREAVRIAKERAPGLELDGEMQVDAAVVPEVGQRKFPGSAVAGKVNVLIFPDLNAGNIGYKLVQRFAHAEALGPIIQGLRKPVNDLSRGCSAEDVAAVAAFTSVQAQGQN